METVYFAAVDGTRLEGWLFRPKGDPAPVVIMAPGLTGTKEGFLEDYAWTFAARGIATLIFDYRTFGGSDGEPRHWVDPERQREDYEAAIHFVRTLDRIDGSRIALWGSSFSGGVALVTASRVPVAAVVAQAPFLETPPSQEPTRSAMARYVVATMIDALGIAPVYVPALGRPGEWAFAKSLECPSVHDFDGPLGAPFWRALPKPLRGGWENKLLARMLVRFDEFQPMQALDAIACPVLLVAAQHDDLVPLEIVRRAKVRARTARLVELPCGHFDLYYGPRAAEAALVEAEFLVEALLGAASTTLSVEQGSCASMSQGI